MLHSERQRTMPGKDIICYIGIGANLEAPLRQNVQAWQSLDRCPGIRVRQVSSLYATAPMGPQDQPPYINSVAEIFCRLSPLDLLDALQLIEKNFGRVRSSRRWVARTLDLDLLLYGKELVNHARLTVPHSGLLQRSFVLHPLLEIASGIEVAEHGAAQAFVDQVEDLGIEKITDCKLGA